MTTGAIAEVERVIVTGSNIPSAEETGPNPVDTYRPADIEKLASQCNGPNNFSATAVGRNNESEHANGPNGVDGTVQFNLRGLLAKETLVLVDGKRVAFGSLTGSGSAEAWTLTDSVADDRSHRYLEGWRSAVYGSDAITGVVNFFLIHKFRGLEIGGSYGNTNFGASNDMGEWEAWIKAGHGR
jgi:iron complex outermembrane receptor protein